VQNIAPGIPARHPRLWLMETPNVVTALRVADDYGVAFKPEETTYCARPRESLITRAPAWQCGARDCSPSMSRKQPSCSGALRSSGTSRVRSRHAGEIVEKLLAASN